MTAKKPSKKNSTPAQRIESVYRRQSEMAGRLTDIEAMMRLDHEGDRKTMRSQQETIRRLLGQLDTIKRMGSWPQMLRELTAANAFVAEPLPAYIRDLPTPVLRGIPVGSAAPGPSTAVK